MATDSTSLIITSVVVTSGVTLFKQQQASELSMKPVIGGWILGMFLFLIATWDDSIARMLAVLIMITALLINGTQLFDAVAKLTGTPKTIGPATPGANPRIVKGVANAV